MTIRITISKLAYVWCLLGSGMLLMASYIYGYTSLPSLAAITLMTIWSLFANLHGQLTAFSPLLLLSISAFLYSVPIGLTITIGGVLTHSRAAHMLIFSPEYSLWLCGVAYLAMLLGAKLSFGYRATDQRSPLLQSLDDTITRHRRFVWSIALISTICGSVLVLVFLWRSGGVSDFSVLSYGEQYLVGRGQGVLLAGLRFLVVGSILLYLAGFKFYSRGLRSKWWSIRVGLPIAVLFFWVTISHRRIELFQFFVALIAARHLFVKKISTEKLFALALVAVASAIAFGIYRGVSDPTEFANILERSYYFNPGNTELGAPFLTISDIVNYVSVTGNYAYGFTYLKAFALLVPQLLWPDRPLSIAEWYAKTFYPDVWSAGGGFGFSAVAEAYMNFSVFGVVLIFLFVGHIAARLQLALKRYGRNISFFGIAYVLLTPYLLMFFRFDFGSFLKSYGVLTLGTVFVLLMTASTLAFRQLAEGRKE